MLIRHVKEDDWAEIVQIETENFSPDEAATPEVMAKRIALIADSFLVAEQDGQIVGYIEGPVVAQPYLTDDLFHEVVVNPAKGGFIAVTSLSVRKDFQKQGVGTALLAALKDLAVSQGRAGIILTCHDYLISYYELNGFTDEGPSQSNHGGSLWYNMLWKSQTVDGRIPNA